ncbi:peptide/nickel transport system permease protein [Catenulispora sp. GAS73]|uniref:ABC transporter permease n=1 Tax=Catenulispora sp. GAS73 TaxID=3156269 RepID=UPI003512EC83
MIGYLIRRVVGAVVVLLALSAIVYALFYAGPSDPALLACGKGCTPDRLAVVKSSMGLDKPLVDQYLSFLHGIFFGRDYSSGPSVQHCPAPCLGYSFETEQPVTTILGSALPVSASLAFGALALSLLVGIGAGLVTVLSRRHWLDRALNAVVLVGYATPVFLVALVLLIVFCSDLQWLPFPTYVPLTQDPAAWAQNLLLPWIALALIAAAAYARMTRAQTLEILSEDHVRTARAYGLPERRVITGHVLRGALTPLVTMAAIDLANIMTSAVLTETMFGLPGIGQALVSAVGSTDLPVIVGVTLTAGAVYVVANALADVLYAAIDPRVELT